VDTNANVSEEGPSRLEVWTQLVRDRHHKEGLSIGHLLGTSAWGVGARQLTLPESPSPPLYLAFLLYPYFNFLISLLYLISVSQKPYTILKLVGAGLHIPFGVWPFLSLLFFPFALMSLVITIP
jgi:hypothetical protein